MLICESCDHGYREAEPYCSWCGNSSVMAHSSTVHSIFDTECYPNYWRILFSTGEMYQMTDSTSLDVDGLRRTLSRYVLVGFNSNNYDLTIVALALSGYRTEDLYEATQLLIEYKMPKWKVLRQYSVKQLYWVETIDIMNVLPGAGSLKAYGAKKQTARTMDLPIQPGTWLNWYARTALRDYHEIDITVTEELFDMFSAQLQLRRDIGAKYGIDVMSKSDPQIAEAVMSTLLPFAVGMPFEGWSVDVGAEFYYKPPSWLKFQKWDLIEQVCAAPFSIAESGSVVKPEHMRDRVFHGYVLGNGGLHSTEEKCFHIADSEYVLRDHDVASYYPALMLALGIIPQHIGEIFLEIYRDWYDTRLGAKRAGNKKDANSYKTLLNGTFGKLASRFSIFYSPTELLQVTLTGQLALLMLIEMLETSGIQVVSANTDGIVLKCPRTHEWVADDIIAWWERCTGFQTEQTNYSAVYSRDVNSYIAFGTDGSVKCKGEFAPPEPGPSGWPNPTGQICVTAMIEYLRSGTDILTTLMGCTDIRQFVYVRGVDGGGALCLEPPLPKKASQKYMAEITGLTKSVGKDALLEAYQPLVDERLQNRRYLGKVVRWYYAHNSTQSIVYNKSGNQVPLAVGVNEVMDLPDSFPSNIDYMKYFDNTVKLLLNVGVVYNSSK